MLCQLEADQLNQKLRECQRNAVARIEAYLGAEFDGKSMLVCLPTGAGKTGVIATICQKRPSGATLVLSPRRSVCDQLQEQVAGKFFQDRGVEVGDLYNVGSIGAKDEGATIVIDTFQKLVVMSEIDREQYLQRFDLVIVDEGHSEPAPTWGKIVRSIECKKVIVTATPYRNDLFQFDIGPISFGFTFKAAVEQGVVLEPGFKQMPSTNIVAMVSEWLENSGSAKCIVKCEDYQSVRDLLRGFCESGIPALGFHDRFARSGEARGMASVPPRLAAREERVLVHQHKLDEGVDIPNAKLLVLTYAVSNGRELVQATGRVVRQSPGSPEVWDCAGGSNCVLWKNYRDFDAYISDEDEWDLFLKSLDSATLITAYLGAFPSMSYYGRSFRRTFDIETFDPDSDLRLPLASVCFMNIEPGFSIPAFIDTLLWELRGQGELVRACESKFGVHVIVSVTFDNSQFLQSDLFFQPRIEVIVAKLLGRRLALLDSRSADHSCRAELKTGRPVDVGSLLKLASRDKARRTRETHARSVSTTRRRAERVSFVGQDLEGMESAQSNANYALSIAKVDNLDEDNNRTTSYYLGVGSGRVSDQKKRNFNLGELAGWVDEINKVMDESQDSVSGVLSSFALPLSGAAGSNEVLSVTIDLSDLETAIVVRQEGRQVELLPGFYFEKVSNDRLHVGGIPLSIFRDVETGAIKFRSQRAWYVVSDTADPTYGESFADWLNGKSLKALLSGGISYLEGSYYLVSLPTQRGFDLLNSRLGRQFCGVEELQANPLVEKGYPSDGRFSAGSIF